MKKQPLRSIRLIYVFIALSFCGTSFSKTANKCSSSKEVTQEYIRLMNEYAASLGAHNAKYIFDDLGVSLAQSHHQETGEFSNLAYMLSENGLIFDSFQFDLKYIEFIFKSEVISIEIRTGCKIPEDLEFENVCNTPIFSFSNKRKYNQVYSDLHILERSAKEYKFSLNKMAQLLEGSDDSLMETFREKLIDASHIKGEYYYSKRYDLNLELHKILLDEGCEG